MTEAVFFGLKLSVGRIEEFIYYINRNIEMRKSFMQITGVNPNTFMLAGMCKELKSIINQSDLVNIDGISLVWGLRLFGYYVPERVACCDIFSKLMELANKQKYSVFFLGTSPEMIEKLVENFSKMYPLVKIAGYHHGYFKPEDEEEIVKEIRVSKADMLFIGMPSPQKEIFIFKNKAFMQIPFSFGVGGLFDILAGKVKRAPLAMQRFGLEWLYRLIQEPKKMISRDLQVMVFLLFLFKERIKKIFKNS